MDLERNFRICISFLVAFSTAVIFVFSTAPIYAQVGGSHDESSGLGTLFSDDLIAPDRSLAPEASESEQLVQGEELQEPYDAPLSGSELFNDIASNLNEEQTEAMLSSVLRNLDATIEGLSPEDFDIAEIANRIGPDPEALAEWVRDNIALVPYHGNLKSAQGSLNDGHANNLDRALLLSALLGIHKVEVRLVRVRLGEEDTRGLLRSVSVHSFDDGSELDKPIDGSLAKKIALDVGIDEDAVSAALDELHANHDATMQLARDMFEAISPPLVAAANEVRVHSDQEQAQFEDARAFDALRDHWLVEFEQDGEWTRLPLTEIDQTIEALERYPIDALPERYRHQLRVTMKVSFDMQPAKEVLTLDLPTAEFRTSTPTISILPVDSVSSTSLLDASAPIDLAYRTLARYAEEELTDEQIIDEKPLWLPVFTLGKSRFVYDKAIDLSGELIEGSTLTSRASTIGNKIESVGDQLFSMGTEPEAETKEPEQAETFLIWLEVQTISPDGKARTSRRVWAYNLPENLTPSFVGSYLYDMGQVLQLDVSTGRPSARFLNIQYLRSMRSILTEALDENGAQVEGRDPAFLAFELNRWIGIYETGASYLARPNVVGLGVAFDSVGTTSLTFDIMQNDVEFMPGKNKSAFDERVKQGVSDTIAEALLADLRASNDSVSNAALDLFDVLETGDVDFTPAINEQTSLLRWAGGNSSSDVVALVTQESSDVIQPLHFWEIDMKSGLTIGRDTRGRGQVYVDEITLLARVIFCATAVGSNVSHMFDHQTPTDLVVSNFAAAAGALTCISYGGYNIIIGQTLSKVELSILLVIGASSGFIGVTTPFFPTRPAQPAQVDLDRQFQDMVNEYEHQQLTRLLERQTRETNAIIERTEERMRSLEEELRRLQEARDASGPQD